MTNQPSVPINEFEKKAPVSEILKPDSTEPKKLKGPMIANRPEEGLLAEWRQAILCIDSF